MQWGFYANTRARDTRTHAKNEFIFISFCVAKIIRFSNSCQETLKNLTDATHH